MSVLHIGVRRQDVNAVAATIASHESGAGFRLLDLEGCSSWEQWGEAEWAGREPQHLLIGASSPEVRDYDYLALVADLQHAHPGALQPMTFRYQRGILASITRASDWSEPTFDVVDVQAKRWLDRHGLDEPGSVNEQWWDRVSWLEYLATREEAS